MIFRTSVKSSVEITAKYDMIKEQYKHHATLISRIDYFGIPFSTGFLSSLTKTFNDTYFCSVCTVNSNKCVVLCFKSFL